MDIPGYTLKHRIGQGRFAGLYVAEDNEGRTRAIKLIDPLLSQQTTYQEAFKNYAQDLVNVDHPNCMKVYEAGVVNNQCYMVMDYYPDGSIAPRLIFGFPVKQIIKITQDLISALDYLNKNSLQHKNIQPRNIFLTANNEVILSEIEISKTIISENKDIIYEDDEQIKQLVDCQSDFNCLGLVFFKLLNRETTPYLEVPTQPLSGRRAICWQPTINKLFSNHQDEVISDIYQLKLEIDRVQNEFKQRIEEYKLPNHSRTAKQSVKENVNTVKSEPVKKHELAVYKPKKLNIQSFLLHKQIPIMVSLAASTAFVLMLSAFIYVDRKYSSPEQVTTTLSPDILFPQSNTLVSEELKKKEQEEKARLAEIEEARLAALKQREKEARLAALKQREEEARLAALKQREEEARLAALKQREEEARLAALKQQQEEARQLAEFKKKQQETKRRELAALKQKQQDQEKARVAALKKKKEQQRLAVQAEEKQRIAALKKQQLMLEKQRELQKAEQIALEKQERLARQQRIEQAREEAEQRELALEEQKIRSKSIIEREKIKNKPKFDSFATF